MSAARRILKPEGSIWVIGSYHNIFRVGAMLQDMGFWILKRRDLAQDQSDAEFPRHPASPTPMRRLIWAAWSADSRYTFNYRSMKSLNDDLQMRSDWTLPICGGPERLKGDDGRKTHPTQKPESLLYRVIMSSTNVDDVVLDPFFGTGTTGALAKKLGRRFIGIERDPDYAAAAASRIAAIDGPEDLSLVAPIEKRGVRRESRSDRWWNAAC